ncbi:MAG: TadE/TadG family type IV pilus assembly protein [Acidimicrobiales bacterium]|nr:TadE/TadG family type IV pilus assembly protein [Acidimicrobiales bacterium]MDG2218446.1 TadE/TadG family type IV pilus assembly protein [Acidimicrobiales bacterium]
MLKGAKTESKKGQATVELALLLPFFALLLMAIIQVGLVVHARVLVTHAAREGARVAAVGASDEEIRQAVAVAGDLPVHRLRVEVARVNGAAVVSVYYVDPTVVPLIGAMLSDVELAATATMRLE